VGTTGLPSIGAHVRTTGVKRPGYGRAGRQIALITNSFVADIPDVVIRHYDVAIVPSTLPSRLNMKLIEILQNNVAPQIFHPQAVYDGRKNMYASHDLALGRTDSREFDVSLTSNGNGGANQRPPKIYKVKVTKVAQINPEILRQFVNGQQSSDNEVLTALMALNVVIRMDPNNKYPFNSRSFFTPKETKMIGGGIELWRGYFQSVRPSIGRLLINVDISTGMMYRHGTLIELCLDFFGRLSANANAAALLSAQMPDRERLRLEKFIRGMRVTTSHTNGNRGSTPRVIKNLSRHGANQLFFEMNGHGRMSVAQYFQQHANRPLRFPQMLCVEVGSGALLPLELCAVPAGQIMRRQIPSDKTDQVVQFSTMKPVDRFRSILAGRDVLEYGQSQYVRTFGLNVKTDEGLLPITGRVLDPPTLKYGQTSKQPTIKPRDGSWNMIDKKFHKPMTIQRWIVVSYEGQRFFPLDAAQNMVKGLIQGCQAAGMTVQDPQPAITYQNGQGNISQQLRAVGAECAKAKGGGPNLVVVILPGDSGNDIYTAVKHFGDTMIGVATQCLKSNKCRNAKPQYWANVSLKINVKLGGINCIPDPNSAALLTDPRRPTIVMGADVQHPAPGTEARPSFTSLVSSVDANCAKYVATTCVQEGRVELIADLKEMCKHVLNKHISYRKGVEKATMPPARLIFYRDGVSEGQFQQVLDTELPEIKAACAELKINPKITLIIVGKRHHIRFRTQDERQADRSGNCPAGTVVDKDLGHPNEFDFYLQSHGGIIGTSRPAHYSVLYDDNGFDADSMQALSFMLCHVYARATRSVSIPAPVYCMSYLP